MGSLVVGYTVCGAFIFQAIEDTEDSSDLIKEVEGCPVCRNERMRLLFEGDGEKKHNCTRALEHRKYLQYAQPEVIIPPLQSLSTTFHFMFESHLKIF